VLHPLGSGGVGTVYRAHDTRSGEEVALKLLSTGGALDPLAARRLAREFETLYALNHPNIVRVFDAGVFQGYPYLAMELVEGLDLRRYLDIDSSPVTLSPPGVGSHSMSESLDTNEVPRFDLATLGEEMDTDAMGTSIRRGGVNDIYALAEAADEPFTADSGERASMPVDPESVVAPEAESLPQVDLEVLNRPQRVARLKDALLQLCEALAYVHAHGLVHRDLKPANVMVDDDRRVRLMDFGLAKFLAASDADVTGSGHVVGTYRYMAPEQLLGEKLDARADLYALGVVVYELLTGRVPFSARSPIELWNLVLSTEAPLIQTINPEADGQLTRLANRLLRKEPAERFQTAEEVFQMLME
jgi:serine/threonine protein kinase